MIFSLPPNIILHRKFCLGILFFYLFSIYLRSREQWFGNLDPETQGVVHTSLAHVWPGVRIVKAKQITF